eukprot:440867-Pelagomonas_calceolata.AAC.2
MGGLRCKLLLKLEMGGLQGILAATSIMVCKHMGPCEACLPQGEAAYKQCFKCGGGTKLHRYGCSTFCPRLLW